MIVCQKVMTSTFEWSFCHHDSWLSNWKGYQDPLIFCSLTFLYGTIFETVFLRLKNKKCCFFSLNVCCVLLFCVSMCCSVCWFLYGALKLDMSALFTTFFLWTSLPFLLRWPNSVSLTSSVFSVVENHSSIYYDHNQSICVYEMKKFDLCSIGLVKESDLVSIPWMTYIFLVIPEKNICSSSLLNAFHGKSVL